MTTKQKTYVDFVFYFAILLVLGTAFSEIEGQPDLFATIENFMTSPGVTPLGDPSSFAMGAIDVYKNGWFSDANKWLINLWPPGFMLLEALILSVFGISSPFILILAIFASAFGAVVMLLLKDYLLNYVSATMATLIPLVPFLFSVTRLTLLQPHGLILGETFSILFFITAVLLILRAFRDRSFTAAITSGLMLAFSAYFRSQFEILVIFLTLGAIPILSWISIKLWKGVLPLPEKANLRLIIVVILLSLSTAHLTMLPWRIYNFINPYADRIGWVSTQTLTYLNAGQTNEKLLEVQGGWVVEGGGNLACNLEPTYCGKSDKKLYYAAFYKHLGEWYRHKFSIVGKYWFSSLKNFTNIINTSTFLEDIVNFILLLCVFATLPLFWLIRRSPDSPLYAWIFISFYPCFFIIFTFVQFEVRYFYFIKIFSLFSTSMLFFKAKSILSLLDTRDIMPANNSDIK